MKKNNKIRVLWFVNTPSLASKKFGVENSSSGSWIQETESLIRKSGKVELAVAFLHDCKKIHKFSCGGALYYMIPNKYSNLKVRNFKDLIWVVNDFKPELINIFGTEGPYGLITNKIQIPVIIRMQGVLQSFKQAQADRISIFESIKSVGFIEMCSMICRYLSLNHAIKREPIIIKSNKYFIGQTNYDQKAVLQLSPEAKYFRVESVIREPFFKHRWKDLKSEKLKIISVISPRPKKGLGQLLRSAKQLRQLGIDFEWKTAGVVENDLIVKSVEINERITFQENNVKFMGTVEVNKLIKAMLGADIYVHPSYFENDSTSVIEAMVLGMPIIANYTGGLPTILENYRTCLFSAVGDHIDMTSKIIEIYQSSDLKKKLGKQVRETALKKYNSKKSIVNLLNAYKTVLDQPTDDLINK